MLTRFLKSYRASICYHKACKLYNAKRCDEALKVLSTLDATPEYDARAMLFEADILHRKGDIKRSVQKYALFIAEGSQLISKEADRQYLTVYAHYFMENAQRKLDSKFLITVNRSHVEQLYKRASYLIRAEFVI